MPRLLLALVAAGLLFADWPAGREERFLETARITEEVPAGKGINGSKKAILTDGRRTHPAHIQTVDIFMPLFKGKDGSEEKNFKDSWKFNVAAYRLARLLRLTNMVPVSVERRIGGKPVSLDWWVDDVLMDEKERVQRHIKPPDMVRWNRQMDAIRIFDQLIYNMDRSQENLLITRNWDVWMIDHTRAFRAWRTLRNPAAITHSTPDLYRSLVNLRRADVERELGPFLTQDEIDGLMARRNAIVDKLAAGRIPGFPTGSARR
jgi:hypothetical protein